MSTLEKALLALCGVGIVMILLMFLAAGRISESNNNSAAGTEVATPAPTPVEETSPLVGHWVADDWDGAGSAWIDRVSGQKATVGRAADGPVIMTGAIQGMTAQSGVVFDGIDDYFSVAPDQNPIGGSRRATIVAFFTATAGASGIDDGAWTSEAGPLQGTSRGANDDWGLTYDSSGQAQGFLGSRIEVSPPVDLADGRPHTMALTWESVSLGGDGLARLYVDGAPIGSTETSNGLTSIDDKNGFVIGTGAESIFICCEGSDTNRYFSGAIGELRFYDSIEDPAVVHAEMLGGTALTGGAGDLSAETAEVTGTGYLNGFRSEVYFRYGEDPLLETDTETSTKQTVGPSADALPIADTLAGLSPNARYYFRLEIENESGTFVGQVQSLLLAPELQVEDSLGDQVLAAQPSGETLLAALGAPTAPQQYTIINTGGFDLTDLAVTIEGDQAESFAVSVLTDRALAPGTSTRFNVTFTPPSLGELTAEIVVTSNVVEPEAFRFTINGAGAKAWTGPSITFTNTCAECAIDLLSPNVSITRGEVSGIYNPTAESASAGKEGNSPLDTEWAYGTTADLGSLTFRPWFEWLDFKAPARAVDRDAVLHLITDDIYIDIRFTSWVDGSGGGFSYVRSTPDP